MNNQTSILNDADLEAVSGGLTCENAITAASVYSAIANVFTAMNDPADAATWNHKSVGVLKAYCSTPGK